MTRWIILAALLLLALPASAADFLTTTAASGQACSGGPGQVCYARVTTSDTTAYLQTNACKTAKVRFWSNIADEDDHDGTLITYDVPKGVTVGTDALARPIPYRDAAGTGQTALTGDDSPSVGRGSIYGIQAHALAFVATIAASQTGLISVECE